MTEIIVSSQHWNNVFDDALFKTSLESTILPAYINTCRWYAGKARQLISIKITSHICYSIIKSHCFILILRVVYKDGDSERYLLPISFTNSFELSGDDVHLKGIIADANFNNVIGQLIDAIYDTRFQQAVFQDLVNNTTITDSESKIVFNKGKGLAIKDEILAISSRVLLVEQSNSSIIYGEKYFMKLYRKLFAETNPEVEMVAFLTDNSNFKHIPAFAGKITWQQQGNADVTLAMIQQMIDNQTDTWTVTGESLNGFINSFSKREFTIDEDVFEKVELLAKRTAEMHLGLYTNKPGLEFSAVKFNEEYRQFIYSRIQNLLENRYNLIIENYTKLEPDAQKLAWDFMEAKELIDDFIQEVASTF